MTGRISVLIIDDEAFNRSLIKTLLSVYGPDFDVIGEAENVQDAKEKLGVLNPDVVFLDIKMPDGSGFDLLKDLPGISFETVFVTGFDEYALAAFEYHAIDYILKPIDIDKFKSTLNRLVIRLQPTASSGNLTIASRNRAMKAKIPLFYDDKVVTLDLDNIIVISSKHGKSVFHTVSGDEFHSPKSLTHYGFLLETHNNFLQVNDDCVINLNHVVGYAKSPGSTVTLRNSAEIPVDSGARKAIIQAIERSI